MPGIPTLEEASAAIEAGQVSYCWQPESLKPATPEVREEPRKRSWPDEEGTEEAEISERVTASLDRLGHARVPRTPTAPAKPDPIAPYRAKELTEEEKARGCCELFFEPGE